MASQSSRAAKNRIDVLVTNHAEDLLRLSPEHRTRVLDAAWLDGNKRAETLLGFYGKAAEQKRVNAAKKGAATKRLNKYTALPKELRRSQRPEDESRLFWDMYDKRMGN